MFTTDDKEKIRRYLGYPAEATYMTLIDKRCGEAAAAAPGVVTTIKTALRELGRIDQEKKSTRPFMERTLTSNASGTNQRSPSFARDYSQQMQRQYIDEIAATLRLPVHRYPFTESSGWGSSGKIVRA